MNTPQDFLVSQKSAADMLFGLSTKAFEGFEKLVELNLQVARTSLEEAAESAQSAFAVKDPKDMLAMQTAMFQAMPEKATAYGRHVYSIVAGTTGELRKAAEASAAQSQQTFVAAVDAAVKNAPAGSENVVALVKSAVAAANNAYDGVTKAANQAASAAEANFEAASVTAAKATKALSDKRAA
ncbi:phasin family protein [soil metagenome]